MKYDYEYMDDGKYCYPDSNVLKNKLNIIDEDKLSEVERKISLIMILKLDEKPIEGAFDLEHLKAIHKSLFGEIYEWAGEIRTVDISKGTMFCKCQYIVQNADKLFNLLKEENYLRGMSLDEIIRRAAFYLCEINMLHPFREGNGRVQRAFMVQLIRSAGYDLDFGNIGDEEMIFASARGAVMDYGPMEKLFRRCIIQ